MLLLIFSTAVGIFLYLKLESMAQEFLFSGGAGYSTASRIFQYVYSWPLILQSPYFGYGFARNIVDYVQLYQLDSYYLRMTLEGGLIALLSLLAVQLATWRRLRSLEKRTRATITRELAIALQTSVGLIVAMMLALNMSVSSFYCYLLAGIAIQLVNLTGRWTTIARVRSHESSELTDGTDVPAGGVFDYQLSREHSKRFPSQLHCRGFGQGIHRIDRLA